MESDVELIIKLLLTDPITSELLTIEQFESDKATYSITVGNMSGDVKWKHTITSEEV